MNEELPAGWAYCGATKAHFFTAGSSRCLCGKWAFFYGARDDSNHTSPDNCAECKRQRAAMLAPIKPKPAPAPKPKPVNPLEYDW